ncbi:MAG: 4'-phosphopantetheinyl transferase superfamily protein [Lachnospiraceae bacterium]|nr:4'-phosphopantetheinyl transferase superfamily protein [Lachnospiraceae bacterium]
MRDLYVRLIGLAEMEGAPLPQKEISALARRAAVSFVRELFGIPEDELIIAAGRYGKPYFPNHPEACFNISHAGDYIMLAVSSVPLGCDIEKLRISDEKKLLSMARHIFSGKEYDAYLAGEDKVDAFFRAWVLKEAESKWLGCGFAGGFNKLPGEGVHALWKPEEGYYAAVWAGEAFDLHLTKMKGTDIA